jgi:dienelactone hydrolase
MQPCIAAGLICLWAGFSACGGEERKDVAPVMTVPTVPSAGGAAPPSVTPPPVTAPPVTTPPVTTPPATMPPATTPPVTTPPGTTPGQTTPGNSQPDAGTAAQPDAGDKEPVASGDAIVRGDAPTESTGEGLGPFKVAEYTSGFADQAGFSAGTVYYPTDAEPPFAYIVFCPGFVSYQTSIQDWGPFFASHGIVTMTIDTNTSSDSVQIRKTALMDAFKSLQLEDERADSPIKGKLHKTRFGLAGWSMGGGASLLNGSEHPEFKSIITLTEHLATAPGGVGPLKELKVPTLMFAGTADTAILGGAMSQPAYDAIPESTQKMLYEVEGADHFFFNTPKALEGVVGRYGLAWQKVFLEGDERYRKLLGAEGPQASDFRSNLE